MASAEIIAIGTELLLGEIQDTNIYYITRQLRNMGIDVYRTTMVGDNAERIAQVMRECLQRSDFVITTGGLGPTVDDPTRDAAALANQSPIEFHPELWDQISSRFLIRGITPPENNRKQALLPQGAKVLPNPVGTAPAFYLPCQFGILICLPGVPSEMQFIFENSVIKVLRKKISANKIIKTRVLHTCNMGESAIDVLIEDLERLSNPTVGLAAHPASVDIRITAKASSEESADQMIFDIEKDLRERLPQVIFGIDDDSLPTVIDNFARRFEEKIKIYLSYSLKDLDKTYVFSNFDSIEVEECNFSEEFAVLVKNRKEDLTFGVNLYQDHEVFTLDLFYKHDKEIITDHRPYNGPRTVLGTWVTNTSLGFIWRHLAKLIEGEQYAKS